MGIRLDGTTDTISAPGSDLNLGQSGDSVKVASQVQLPTHGALSNRRININGAMQVAQRGTVTNAGNEYGGPDRYRFAKNDGAYTISQDTDVPSGSGFRSSFKIDVTSAASSTGNQYVIFQHKMEGQDLQQFKKGTSSAESFTLQFWIKSTKTGTYVVEFLDNDNSRHVCKTYTVSSSNTWEYKTITFPADTSGVLDNDNGASLQLNWWLYAGSTYTSGTLSTSWKTFADADSAVGQVNAADDTSNNILFTGVQLEVGEKATPFEHRSYGDELARCQRYFYAYELLGVTLVGGNTALCNGSVYFPVEMRSAPTLTSTSVDRMTNIGEANHNGTYTFGSYIAEKTHCAINYSRSSGDTWNQGTPLSINDTGGSTIMNANSEL